MKSVILISSLKGKRTVLVSKGLAQVDLALFVVQSRKTEISGSHGIPTPPNLPDMNVEEYAPYLMQYFVAMSRGDIPRLRWRLEKGQPKIPGGLYGTPIS